MQKTVVQLVCDGCGAELEGEIVKNAETKRREVRYPAGVAVVKVDVSGSKHLASLELCPECAGQLPEGTTRKRPVPLTDEQRVEKDKKKAERAAKKAA